jgi:2-keto-4-pentenoate hydratase/2-oxohepta-3-ene-1,7-dioic acid hydratase in catechol pathway
MAAWVRFLHQGLAGFGKLQGDTIQVHEGDLFTQPVANGQTLRRGEVSLLPPCEPDKMLALWNNFHERAEKEGLSKPAHPLYFVKVNSCFAAAEQPIRQPASYSGPVVFEGELGVVIGKACYNVPPDEIDNYIFGYTCVNDVTAKDIMKADPSFVQWSRAKGYDTFGVFGPAIVTDIEPDELVVKTCVNGEEKQNYPVSDMFYRPREIVSLLSQDMTLNPGDVIACGTSIGTEAMPAGCTVEIIIEGVGTLQNIFQSP